METLKVAIVDDHEAVRLGFAGTCQQSGFELVGSAATVDDLLLQISDKDCAVVIADLSLADGSLVQDNIERLVDFGAAVLIYSIMLSIILFELSSACATFAAVPNPTPCPKSFN